MHSFPYSIILIALQPQLFIVHSDVLKYFALLLLILMYELLQYLTNCRENQHYAAPHM